MTDCECQSVSDVGYDFLFAMEHEGFHLPNLRLSLQFLLDRKRIATQGTLQPDVVPLDTIEQARAVVMACRYPQALEAPDREPAGQRGWAPLGPRGIGA